MVISKIEDVLAPAVFRVSLGGYYNHGENQERKYQQSFHGPQILELIDEGARGVPKIEITKRLKNYS